LGDWGKKDRGGKKKKKEKKMGPSRAKINSLSDKGKVGGFVTRQKKKKSTISGFLGEGTVDVWGSIVKRKAWWKEEKQQTAKKADPLGVLKGGKITKG